MNIHQALSHLQASLLPITVAIVCLLQGVTSNKDDGKGHWGEWGEVSQCSVTCGSGTQHYQRVYIPGPNDPPSKEPLVSRAVYSCTDPTYPVCPEDGRWSGWSHWSECSKGCGGGERKRKRSCMGQTPGGKDCEGENFDKEKCNKDPCPRLPPHFDLTQCKPEANFTCESEKMCIDKTQKCDDKVQCHDGSDEMNCPLHRYGSVRYDLGNGMTSIHSLIMWSTLTISTTISVFVFGWRR